MDRDRPAVAGPPRQSLHGASSRLVVHRGRPRRWATTCPLAPTHEAPPRLAHCERDTSRPAGRSPTAVVDRLSRSFAGLRWRGRGSRWKRRVLRQLLRSRRRCGRGWSCRCGRNGHVERNRRAASTRPECHSAPGYLLHHELVFDRSADAEGACGMAVHRDQRDAFAPVGQHANEFEPPLRRRRCHRSSARGHGSGGQVGHFRRRGHCLVIDAARRRAAARRRELAHCPNGGDGRGGDPNQ